jgi:DNA-binding XRE family transcriptional regulator
MSDAAITAKQCRAGRALLDWTQGDLASATGISIHTIRAFERERDGTMRRSKRNLIKSALESAGVIFVEENGEVPGVRLRKRIE